MAPTGDETGCNNATVIARFALWNEPMDLGVAFDASTCFRLLGEGDRCADRAWVAKARWEALSLEQRRRFPPLCPDCVLELASPSDNVALLRAKRFAVGLVIEPGRSPSRHLPP